MTWKDLLTDYFTFSRKDRIATLVILSLVLLIFLLPKTAPIVPKRNTQQTDTSWIAAVRELEIKASEKKETFRQYDENNTNNYQYDRSTENDYEKTKGELFYFDPNTLSFQNWQRLGLKDKTITIIQNYLNKGGHFYAPTDLQKIYGLSKANYERLLPFIRIEQNNKVNNYSNTDKSKAGYTPGYKRTYQVIDINTADTTAYISLPGIGSKLAARIINFRDKLGGFYSINQVGEAYGITDSTFQKIKQYLRLENIMLRKININTATIDELKAHPYIKYNLANPIIAYRNQHGAFLKLEDIKKIMIISDEVYDKIAPYLSVQ